MSDTSSGIDLENDPVDQGIDYTARIGVFNSAFLKAQRLNQQQLQQAALVIKQILQDYTKRKPFVEMPEKLKKHYGSESSFIKEMNDAEKTSLSLVGDFLLNVAKVIGSEKTLEGLRKGSKEPTKEEINYAYALVRVGKLLEETNPYTRERLTQRDLEAMNSAVDSAYKLIERK